MIKKFLIASTLITTTALFMGCTPTVFGVPQTEWAQMSPAQKQIQIQQYNAEQKKAAEEKPMWDALGALAGMVGNSPKVQQETTHQHCSNNSPPPVCQKNPDGSIHCTQQSSGSCESIGL